MEYFAKIQEPKKLRLSLMKAARESIILVSLLEEIERLRETRAELMDAVKEDFKSMEESCNALLNLLGDEKSRQELINSFRETQKEEEREDAKAVRLSPRTHSDIKARSKQTPVLDIKAKTEVDRLEYTLKQIEDKIASLSR